MLIDGKTARAGTLQLYLVAILILNVAASLFQHIPSRLAHVQINILPLSSDARCDLTTVLVVLTSVNFVKSHTHFHSSIDTVAEPLCNASFPTQHSIQLTLHAYFPPKE